ncbi:MAG: response regulator [Actinobacteria bacterium]|nr:response regulator [Actinomycetota bacterium]
MATDKKQTILIVEDESALLKVYAECFMKEGFLVLKAVNGREGLDIALREKPDIILLDILMPVMNGLTMMQKIRENNVWGKAVPILLLTNLAASEEKVKKIVSENQPVYYLVKLDWSLSAIVEKVKKTVLLWQA